MAFCTKCGTMLADGADYCGKCGTLVQVASVAVASSILLKEKYTTTSGIVDESKSKIKQITTTGVAYEEDISSNDKKKYTDEDGNVYEGDFDDDDLNGEGKITFASGNVYEGEFEDGELNGKGKITFADGSIMEGDFVHGELNGKGKTIDADGDVWEGDFEDGRLNGKGKKVVSDVVGEGEFVDGRLNGKGKITTADGMVYEGDFVDGDLNGRGTITFKDGDLWEGDFVNGILHGKGKITHADGSIMECDFVDGKITGGTLRSAGGNEDFVSATFTVAKDNEGSNEKTAEPQPEPEADDDPNLIDPADPDDYDVVVNAQNEIMIVMYEHEGDPSSPQAFRTADKDIMLKRNANSIIMFDSLPEESFEYFTKVNTILVNEIDADGKSVHVYDVPISDQGK